jgi:hypothetical protein
MLKDIIMILSGLIGGYLLIRIRQFIIKKGVETAKDNFDTTKLTKGMLSISDRVLWAKDIASLFNVRKFIIYGLIIGVIFGYGYFKGRRNAPVHFDMRGKEATIQLNEHYLKIEKDGTAKVLDNKGLVLKTIRVKDIPELERALRQYGFQLKPFFTTGGSLGASGMKAEAGAGVQWFKYFKWNLNSFCTNVGIYPLGVGYQITDNFDVLISAGKGYSEGDTRVYIGGKWRF